MPYISILTITSSHSLLFEVNTADSNDSPIDVIILFRPRLVVYMLFYRKIYAPPVL